MLGCGVTLHTIRLSEAELNERLDERLPQSREISDRLKVTVDNARVRLLDGSDRVHVEFDTTVSLRVAGRHIAYQATPDVSGRIRYEPSEASFYLVEPTIDALALPGVPERYGQRVREALTAAIAQYCASRPLYTIRDDSLRRRATRAMLKDVTVVNRHLVIRLAL